MIPALLIALFAFAQASTAEIPYAPIDRAPFTVTFSAYCPTDLVLYADVYDAETGMFHGSVDWIPCRGFELAPSGGDGVYRVEMRLSDVAPFAATRPTRWRLKSWSGALWVGLLTVTVQGDIPISFYATVGEARR